MKLGSGLPNTMALETDRRLMLDWARLADEAGFHTFATIDKPADAALAGAGRERAPAEGVGTELAL